MEFFALLGHSDALSPTPKFGHFPGERWAQLFATAALSALLAVLSGCAPVIRSRIYRPDARPGGMAAAPAVNSATDVRVRTSDGIVLTGRFVAPVRPGADILVFFPGNAGDLATAVAMAAPLSLYGRGLLVASWRGYSGNAGRPSEAGLKVDGDAFADEATRLAPGSRIIFVGFSLGAAVAIREASRPFASGLVTVGAFSKLSRLAPLFIRPFLPDRFDNETAIGKVHVPIFMIHGSKDEIVPIAEGRRLFARASGEKHFVVIEDAPHHVDFAQFAERLNRSLDELGENRARPLGR